MKPRIVDIVGGRTIGILGLAFKLDTETLQGSGYQLIRVGCA